MTTGQSIPCPRCGAPIEFSPDLGVKVDCRHCGSTLNLARSICPSCDYPNREGRRTCAQCETPIVRVCTNCRQENWGGLEHCLYCGRPLDILEAMTGSRTRDTRVRLDSQQREATMLKQKEDADAQARMDYFWDLERQRQEELATRRTAQQKHERRFVATLLLVAAAMICLLVAIYLTWSWVAR